ncbi:hypothetical protein O5O45_07245 [Hahella aquimaris]|uniref:hypothetical protein n=1 Tax=Hahella sp. HNIBRBA332 TaxID=3015983 RepID=UPI00273BA674|nr:hypothetical protein [Hahella sp. HNIBRBA332]WLQ15708.1 hypothetical protein O5O45_07245 [Hahella sp. HNIBRBA332]
MKMSKRERAISIVNNQNKLELIQVRRDFIEIDSVLTGLCKTKKSLLEQIDIQESEFRAMQQPGAQLDLHRLSEIGGWLNSAAQDVQTLDRSINEAESDLRIQLEKLAQLEAAQEVIKQKMLDERSSQWAELEQRTERDISELNNPKNLRSTELSYGA